MAQYYQIVGQPTMSLEDLRQFYPNITCIESAGGVQYVINNQEEGGGQFESQQVLLSTDQQILLNSSDSQQIVIDQSQIQYSQQSQQYSVQDNEVVDYQQNEVVVNNQQIYYTSPKQHIIQQSSQAPILAQQLTQPQIPNQQIMNNTPRVVTQQATSAPIRPVVPQPQRRVPVAQNQQTVTPPRAAQPNVGVRIQYALQEQQQDQNQQLQMNQDDNQMVFNEGRVMTLGQFKQELAQNQQENHQNVQQNCVDKQQYKAPPPKRNYKRTNNGRGAAGGAAPVRARGRGVQTQQLSPNNNPKPFQQVQQVTPQPKPMQQYPGTIKAQVRAPGMQQPPRGPVIQHPNIQHRQIQQQPTIIQQQQQFPPQNNRVQPLIPLSPLVHNGHVQSPQQQPPPPPPQQSPVYSPPNSQGQQYLDDSSSSMSDEYRDSARMLVCLENGEQRLITFTLPKESCTVQDLLEQVGVPFKSDTKIECISNPGNDIDYIVYVGAVNSSPFPIDAQQVLTVDSLGDTQECIVSQSGAVIPVSEPQKPAPPPPVAVPAPPPPPEPPAEPELPPEPPKLLPRFVPGCLAVCNHCGYLSEDFNRCQRCKTRLPEDVKSISLNKEKAAENEKKSPKISLLPKPTLSPKTTVVTTPLIPNTKPPAKNTRGKRKAAQEIEPVVLTLSSDEEDDVLKPTTHATSRVIDNAVTLSAIQKEPVIPADCDIDFEHELEEGICGGGKEEDLKSLQSTTLPCRTVRIGSYRFVPRDEISLTSLGVRIAVPQIVDPSETFILFIPMKYIIKVLGNFNKSLPVLFFYVTPSIGAMIRKNLKMEEGAEFYFDPLSKEDPFKRITLLPEIVYDDTKSKIKEIYLTTPYKMLEELTPKEANDILIRTCPREGGIIMHKGLPVTVGFTEMRQLVIYPPGKKGGIAINSEDYMCLAQDQFLNDVIIDFYLKYLVTDVLAPSMQQKVYIFSSFFYKRLTTKPTKASKYVRSNPYEVDSNLTPAEKRHMRVKSWTKGVNIFEKDYIIIPINENSHWFLAIICYPGLEGCRSMIDSTKIIKVPTKEKKKINTITIGNTTISALKDDKTKVIEKPIKCDDEEGSDRDEAEGDESELEESENESDQGEQPPEKKSNQREPIKQPCILIFDSLAGASRSRVVATLRDYLTWEHRTKLSSTKTFNKDNIKGACPKVPQQMNFTDCGLYVLQYVESFFKDPITDYHIPIKMLKTWFEEIVVTRKREDLSNLIKELMVDNKKDPSILPDIQFPTLNGELVSHMEGHFEGEEGEAEMEEEVEEDDEDLAQSAEKIENSLTQISAMYNSDSSCESPVKTETNLAISATSTFVVSNVNSAANKPDLSETKNKSNRDTMSYLKSKRINRHKNQDANENKKQKID